MFLNDFFLLIVKLYTRSKITGAGPAMLGLHGALSLLGGMRGKPRRGMLRRAVFSDFQRKGLEKVFQKQKYISKPDRKKLAEKLGLKDSQVTGSVNETLTITLTLHCVHAAARFAFMATVLNFDETQPASISLQMN